MLSHSMRPEGRSPRTRAVVAGWSVDEATARALLAHDDPATRASALGALERLGTLDLDDLGSAAEDPSPAVRRRVARLAGRRDDGAPLVTAMLGDDAPLVVEEAAFACGELLALDALEQLVSITAGHDNPLCREAAVAALGAIGDPDGLGAVLAAAQDIPAIRRRAAIALAAFVDIDEALGALRALLEDHDWQVRQAAEDVLAAVDPDPLAD